jgi:uncharacterized protein
MIKDKMISKNITSLLPKAFVHLEKSADIVFAYLFGSMAQGKEMPLSDVDIAIFFSQGADFATRKLEVIGDLIDIIQTDEIDLVVLNTANLPLLMNILKGKKIVVDKKPFVRHIFESLVMRKYFDFSIKEAAILQRRYLSG